MRLHWPKTTRGLYPRHKFFFYYIKYLYIVCANDLFSSFDLHVAFYIVIITEGVTFDV